MPSATEAASASTPLAASLAAGVNSIDNNQTVTFTKYYRVLLPSDGFAFWVKADQLSQSALYNAGAFNGVAYNQGQSITPAATMQVAGSLHYSTINNQDETEGFAVNRIIFTSLTDVEELNTVNPSTLFIAEYDGLRFAFSTRRLFKQAGLFHYQGDAIYPSMASQIIDDARSFDTTNVVVSNSLPIWLSLNAIMPMWPSFLVGDNIVPPWASVHIVPDSTVALQAAPWIDPNTGSHYQLCRERVRITTYGLRNGPALDFQDYVNDYSLNTDTFGIMNMPVFRDEKRTQAELNILAQKKTIEYEITYHQARVRQVALQTIKSVFIDFEAMGGVPIPPPPSGDGLAFNLAQSSQYVSILAGI